MARSFPRPASQKLVTKAELPETGRRLHPHCCCRARKAALQSLFCGLNPSQMLPWGLKDKGGWMGGRGLHPSLEAGNRHLPALVAPVSLHPPPLCSPLLGRSDSKQPAVGPPGAQLSQLKGLAFATAPAPSKTELPPGGGADPSNSRIQGCPVKCRQSCLLLAGLDRLKASRKRRL